MKTVLLRSIITIGCVVGSAVAVAAQEEASEQQVVSPFPEQAPPHAVLLHPHREQRDKYLWGTFGPPGMLDAVLGASFGQWMNTPSAWGQTPDGYFKRLATEYSESAINSTTKYVVARIRDEDPSFRPCYCKGVRRRALHAIVSPFIAYSFDDGKPQFSVARMAGTATSSVISANTWKPTSISVGGQVAHVGTDLLSAMGVNLLREFVFHHRTPQ
jgi:hypothetical protein